MAWPSVGRELGRRDNANLADAHKIGFPAGYLRAARGMPLHLYSTTRGAYGFVTGPSALEENFALGQSSDDLIWFLLIFGLSLLVSLLLDRQSLMIGFIIPTITFFDNIAREIYGMLFAGASLLIFTYFWNSWRARLLRHLPILLAAQLPRTDVVHRGQRPIRRRHELMRRVWKGGS
jgi:hypothetical protein